MAAINASVKDVSGTLGMQKSSNIALCSVVFLSGASALIFENLWFRLAGLTFGNDVWASTLVLSGFMGGLALGNVLAVFYGHRFHYPVRFYAVVEVFVALGGVMLILVLPALTKSFAPLFRSVIDQPWILNPLRLSLAFCLLLIPTTAMGLTLPLLVKALTHDSSQSPFGEVLGKMYGWNTAGAVVGTLVADTVLVEDLGIRASGYVAGVLNLTAAAGALYLSAGAAPWKGKELEFRKIVWLPSGGSMRLFRLLAAGFLAGGILLAFEVVWFRFLLLYTMSTSLMFSIMLAIVLLGIAIGGFAASAWIRRRKTACRFVPVIAWLCGLVSVLIYANFLDLVHLRDKILPSTGWYSISLAFFLMFPISFLSGVLFTLIGDALHQEIGGAATTTGLLTVSNTVGSMIGAAVGGFVLLPIAGIERAFFILSIAYGAVGLLTLSKSSLSPRGAPAYATYGALVSFVVVALSFPFGAMREHYRTFHAGWADNQASLQAVREGLTETIRYIRHDVFGKPFYYRLMTNSFSMSGTQFKSRRYMKMYVYWPTAVHPDLKDALLICFGVGSTANALTDTQSLQSIDIVDISRDIIDMSATVYPNPKDNPVNDPRVQVHIQDGRFFLQTTKRRYDLITGEPPPLRASGTANLYSQEFFELVYDRLRDGGIATYWLPVYQMSREDSCAILKAFSNVFEDCTLWSGGGLDWMMVGTRNAGGPVEETAFVRQWENPAVAGEMRTLGLELPEQLGATFLMDTPFIKKLTKDTRPLVDNYPKRLKDHGFRSSNEIKSIPEVDRDESWRQFDNSAFIRRVWPETMRQKSLPYFRYQPIVDEYLAATQISPAHLVKWLRFVREIQNETTLHVLPLWLLDSGIEQQAIVDQLFAEKDLRAANDMVYHKAVQLAANRRYIEAEHQLARLHHAADNASHLIYFRIFLLAMAGESDRAAELAQEYASYFAADAETALEFWNWAAPAFDLSMPPGLTPVDSS